MTHSNSHLRKAAVLIRSLDAETAAGLLAQLSPTEAAAVREASRGLGPIDHIEQVNLLAEFRRASPADNEPTSRGVELSLSSQHEQCDATTQIATAQGNHDLTPREHTKRFQFLEQASADSLSAYLAREHAQTIAVVLSQLEPARAAAVLASLPPKVQIETMERLTSLGETDPDIMNALEGELATWSAKRWGGDRARRHETMSAILAAADATSRNGIYANLKTHNSALAEQIESVARERRPRTPLAPRMAKQESELPIRDKKSDTVRTETTRQFQRNALPSPPLPGINFDDLIHLDRRILSAVMSDVDAGALTLALAGSRDELVDRICYEMPKKTAKAFRRGLHKLGPTRLTDVEAAQRAVAHVAAKHIAARRAAVTT